jgi:hypothetical protein
MMRQSWYSLFPQVLHNSIKMLYDSHIQKIKANSYYSISPTYAKCESAGRQAS